MATCRCLYTHINDIVFASPGSGGEVFALLESGAITAELARAYFSQFISGVNFLHECGIVHRDLSLENLLLVSSYNFYIHARMTKTNLDMNSCVYNHSTRMARLEYVIFV